MTPRLRSIARAAFTALVLASCRGITNADSGVNARTTLSPVEVAGGGSWSAVSAGFQHSCALDASGTAKCWGSNQYGQLGAESGSIGCADVPTCSRQPLAVSGQRTFVRIASGITHTCALTATGEAWCWGGGYETADAGFLGNGALSKSVVPVRVTSDSAFVDIAVGVMNTCALTVSGQLFCWGANSRGELADGTQQARRAPVASAGALRFTQVTMGTEHACAATSAGVAYCWGHNRFGQLGSGEVPNNSFGLYATLPIAVSGGEMYTRIAAGSDHTCALTRAGVVQCWGANGNASQLGDRSMVTQRGVPRAIADGRTFTVLAAGANTNCARASDGASYCWGSNFFGALGNGSRSDAGVNYPVAVSGGTFAKLAVGGSHSCGIDASQRLYCWGDSQYGQTGR